MLVAVFAATVAGCGEEEKTFIEETSTETIQDPLYVLTSTLWPITAPWSMPTVSVCWEQATGFDTEKAWVRDAITKTWELESQFRFLGWGNCSAGTLGIRARFHDAGGVTANLGNRINGVVDGMKFNTWQSGNGNCVTGWSRERCVRSTAVHEMAHGLGFAHEQNRSDTPPSCTQGPQGPNGDVMVGNWDIDSTTNYCNPVRNGDARLSGTDIHGMVEMYGHPTPITASTWGGSTMAAFIRGPGNAIYEAFTNDGVNWGTFFTQGGVLTSAPSVVSWAPSRLDLFGRGTDGAVYQKYWTPGTGWQGWFGLGGTIKGEPKVIARAADRLDIFARFNDDSLRVRSWNGSSWSNWTSLGQDIIGEPAIASWGSNRLDVLVRARDNTLQHRSWNGTSWSSWTNLGGTLNSSPSAVSWGANRLDVVAVRSDLNLWHRSFNGTSWTGWLSLGGPVLGTPKVTARTANILDIFVRGQDNAVWQRSWNGTGWTGWSSHGGVIKGSPEVATPNASRVDVFVQGTNDLVHRKTWNGSTWTAWLPITGATIE